MAEHDVFVGTYSKGKDNGLFRCSLNYNNGEIKITDTVDIENPSYIKINKNILYGVSETADGALFAVNISSSSKMTITDINKTHGKDPCHLCITDNHIFVCNYSEGSLSIFETDKSGNISESTRSIHHFCREASHIHFCAITPDTQYLSVCDLGMDKVFLYPYSAKSGLSTNAKIINCPSGSGPRHLVFSKCGRFMYILTEMANTVLCYQYDDKNLKFLQEISTLPENYNNKSFASAIHVSLDGKYLAASNRGHDSIVFFLIKDDGCLSVFKHLKTGKEPRDFRYSPDGRMLLSANQNDNSITVYKIEGDDFILTGECAIPKPVCIEFGIS